MIPEPWEFTLLALGAFRVWKLIGDDAILDRPRDWLLDRIATGGREERGVYWADFIVCPWCAGFWITALWWGSWLAWDEGTLAAATIFALSAAVGYLGVAIDKLEG